MTSLISMSSMASSQAIMLDEKHTDAEQAVETLFQVHLLNRMKEEVSKYWDRKTLSTTAKDKTGLTRRSNLLQQWKSRLDALKEAKRIIERKLADIGRGLASQRDQYARLISKEKNREGRLKEAEEAVKNLEREVDASALFVLDDMRNPHALSPGISGRHDRSQIWTGPREASGNRSARVL